MSIDLRQKLFGHLRERYEGWFGSRFEFLLYDIISTYFEGQCARNPQAQRGYSRDQRPDCKQVCIATGCLASNPYPIYARIRRQAPVLWSERWNCWALSRHDDVVAALKDVDHFSPFSTVAGKTLSVYAGWRSF